MYDEGRFAYSHHGTDPISGMLVNAFDLVRVHKFGNDDASTKSMLDLVASDKDVLTLIDKERMADFEDDGILDEDYTKSLDRDTKGVILSTAKNVKIILNNDPNLAGKIALNDFAHRLTALDSLPWREEPGFWSDVDDAGLRNYFSGVYGIVGRGIIDDGLMEVSSKHKYHPVRDYLNGLVWDGECRVDTLLIDYVGAADTPYTRAVTRKWLCGAVARVMTPGVKFDTTLVIYGPQGLGKTLVIERLGGAWFNNTIGDVKHKDAMEQIQGSWICELAELAPTYKNDNEVVKAFLSRTVDRFRAPYGKRTEEYPRQCVFAGTTNNLLFLKDKTGNRRFWPVEGKREWQTKKPYTDLTPDEVGQIWAEALHYYIEGEDLTLSAEIEAYAESVRQRHTEGFEKTGLIIEYLNTPIPVDWYKRSVRDMQLFMDAEDEDVVADGDDTTELMQRDKVCTLEIWTVVFGGTRQNLTNAHAREINDILQQLDGWVPHKNKLRFGKYFGVQRAYVHESRS